MNWLSVHEIARRLCLSPEMIYKQIKKGALPAVYIGSSVRVDPKDFENWIADKKRQNLKMTMPPVLEDFLHHLKQEFPRQIKAVYLYGSYARGNANSESDVDILVIFKTLKNRWEVIRKVRKIAYQCAFDKEVVPLLSTLVISESDWKTREDPLLLQIRKEGISLQ